MVPSRRDIPTAPNLPTAIPGIELRDLTPRDAPAFFDHVGRSRAYLAQYGDYEDLTQMTLVDIEKNFSSIPI